MMTKAILVAMAECMDERNIANISAIWLVLQILSDVSCNLAMQHGSRILVVKFILGGFIQ